MLTWSSARSRLSGSRSSASASCGASPSCGRAAWRRCSGRARSMPNGVPMAWMAALYEHPPIVVDAGERGRASPTSTGTSTSTSTSRTRACSRATAIAAFARAVGERVAAGAQFLLPGEDAAAVAERARAPLRAAVVAVHALGHPGEHRGDSRGARRDRPHDVLMFDGKYHGHADELLGELERRRRRARGPGLPPDATQHVRARPVQRPRGGRARARAAATSPA